LIHAVVLAPRDLEEELRGTLLWRSNVARTMAKTAEEVRRVAEAERADIVVLDSALGTAAEIAGALRRDPLTRTISIVALGRENLGFALVDLLEAGVNAILPLPPGPDWDDRLMRLVHVPVRKVTRLPVSFAVGGGRRSGEAFLGRALNLSVHGILLESALPLEVGEDVRLRFDLPDPFGPVRGTGTVVRIAPSQHFGIELTSVEEDGRIRLRRFVEAPRPEGAGRRL
jgi:CheY-like chemotaxis protein